MIVSSIRRRVVANRIKHWMEHRIIVILNY